MAPGEHTYEPPTPVAGLRQCEPTVAVAIPAYTMKRWPLLKKAVESVRHQSSPVETVVVCIDNNAELLGQARAEWSEVGGVPVRVLPNRHVDHLAEVDIHQRAHGTARRFGAGSARNTAAEVVSSDIIAFMDDDAWAEPDWIEQLLRVYRDPAVIAVGGAPLPEFETQRPEWFPVNFDWVFGCAYEGLPETTAPLRHLIGANMSVRRDALNAVGGFIGSDFDDLNLCMRLADVYGAENIYYAPEAVVHHYVPSERVSWRYFWRRCYFVNRQKVGVLRRLGGAANLAAEREFVWRTVSQRSVTELRRIRAHEVGALRSLGAMMIGLALAAIGNARGQVDQLAARRKR